VETFDLPNKEEPHLNGHDDDIGMKSANEEEDFYDCFDDFNDIKMLQENMPKLPG
jgi:hypothetical protein